MIKVTFTKGDFNHPELGNIWVGREVIVAPKMANRLIALGYAVQAKEPKKEKKDK